MKNIEGINKVLPKVVSTVVFFAIILFFSQTLKAQNTGEVKGNIADTAAAIKGAVVMVQGNSRLGSLTDANGNFIIKNIPSGTYNIVISYFGYNSDTIREVSVEVGKTTTLPPIVMTDEIGEEATIVVVGVKTKNEASEKTAVQDTKKSEKIISVISSEQIQKGQDRDAAEAIRRIPGVTLVDQRFIMVRGLGERYNSVFLNDAGAPSSETDSKAFSFDIIPSQLIDKIQVYKTAAPDLPGDFAGGMVKVYTRASVTERNLQINVQGSDRLGSTFNTFNATGGGSALDFLGFGAGYRGIPDGTPANLNSSSIAETYAVTKNFKNTWGIHNRTAMPDMRLNVYYADKFKLRKLNISNTFNVNYANLTTIYKIHRQDWNNDTTKIRDLDDVQNTNTARLGVIENLSLRFSKNFNVELRNLFSQIGVQQNTLRTSTFQQDQKAYAMSYQSRSIYTTQFTGNLNSDNEKTKYNWSLGYSYSDREMPDLKRIKYTKASGTADSNYIAQVAPVTDPVNGGGRFYSKLKEHTISYNHNLKQTLLDLGNAHIDLNLGSYFEYKARTFSSRNFAYVINPGASAQILNKLPIDQIFASKNVGIPNGFNLGELTDKSTGYTAQNILMAPYISTSMKFFKKFNILGGVRYENNKQSLQSFISTASQDTSVTTSILLPSVNISYSFTEKSLIRLAYGKTLNRPEFREWSPFYFYNFEFNASTYGSLFPTVLNPKGQILKVCKINNFDIRYEFYPSADEMITFGVFYKNLINPIQQVVLNGSDDSKSFTFSNAQTAYITGVELDVRKNLRFLGRSKLLSDLNLVGNASLIKSQVHNTNVIDQNVNSPLQGQSPYVFNAGLYYQNDSVGIQASLLYNVFGPRIYLLGTKGSPSWGEMPRNSLDLTVSKKLSKRTSLTIGIQDILNQAVLIMQDTNNDGKFTRPPKNNELGGPDRLISRYKKGQYFTIGLKINLI